MTIIFLIFGLVMQFPIVLVFLDKLGILDVERLKAAGGTCCWASSSSPSW